MNTLTKTTPVVATREPRSPPRLPLRRIRARIAERAEQLARLTGLPVAEALVSQVLPLADACRFLEREADRVLAPQRLPASGRPFWLRDVEIELRRDPFGTVLVIAPGNNHLFLPAVHTLQALVAGNDVLWKPAPGGQPAAEAFARIVETDRLRVLDETIATADLGADLVVFTGSAETGENVLAQLAPTITPAILELSGDDAVFVRADADLDLVVKAIRFGTQLGKGAVCMRPRRVFAHESLAGELRRRLFAPHPDALPIEWGEEISHAIPAPRLRGEGQGEGLSVIPVRDDDEALRLAAQSPFALGASVFGREPGATELARRVRAGAVTVNDMIVPTADPRFPFGGRGRSGFGVTRGAAGLLAMTQLKAIAVRRGKARPHLNPAGANDAELFAAYLRAAHGKGWRARGRAVWNFMQAATRRSRT